MIDDVWHYAGLDFWNPAGNQRMDRLVELLRLDPGAQVLDVGCGKAELSLRIAKRYDAHVTGVDKSPFALELARAAFQGRAATFLEQEISAGDFAPGSFDAVVWIGGPFVGDDFPATMGALERWLRPGGVLLVGYGFWMQPPPEPFLEATGMDAAECADHAGNIECGEALGLRVLAASVANRDEWDHFEGTIRANQERYAIEHPEKPHPRGRLEQGRAFYLAQQRWGRDTLGFGFYLFGKP